MFSFANFAQVISGITSTVRDAIPTAVLYPLSTTSILLMLIWGHTHDWARLDKYWENTSVFEKSVVAGSIALLFVLVAQILSEFQPTLTRWFLGDWSLLRPFRWYRNARERYYQEKRTKAESTLDSLDEVVELLKNCEGMIETATTLKTISTAKRRIQQFEIITPQDFETKTNGKPAASDKQFTNVIALKTFDQGDEFSAEQVLAPSKPLPNEPLNFVPVRILSRLIPATLAAGDYVTVFSRSFLRTTCLSSDPWLVVVASSSKTEEPNPEPAQLITFAVPKHEINGLIDSSHRRLVVVAEQRHGTYSGTVPASPADRQSNSNSMATNMKNALSIVGIYWSKAFESRKSSRLIEATTGLKADCKHLQSLLSADSTACTTELPSFKSINAIKKLKLDWDDADKDARKIFAVEYQKILKPIRDARDDWAGDIQLDQMAKYSKRHYEISATRAGNILLAAQYLSEKTYGARIDLIMPALKSSISDGSKQQLKLAEERFSMLQWSWVGLLVTAIVGTAIAWTGSHETTAALVWGLAVVLMFLVGGQAMNNAARGFADALRLAVTMNRAKVLAVYGLTLPTGEIDFEQERPLWEEVHWVVMYGKPPKTYQLSADSGTAEEGAGDA